MGRMGAVGEIDGMCVLLCSRAGSYINGSDHIIDGKCSGLSLPASPSNVYYLGGATVF